MKRNGREQGKSVCADSQKGRQPGYGQEREGTFRSRL